MSLKVTSANCLLLDVNASCEIGFGLREQLLRISGLRHRLDLEAAEAGGGRLCSLHRGAFDETLGLTDAEVPKPPRLAGVCTRHFGSILNDSLQVGPSFASIPWKSGDSAIASIQIAYEALAAD